jgi:pimeloyl-ACP methyl ester carboxylesterase
VPYVNVNGARLFYEEAGAGPPVVLVHGGLGDLRMWDGVVPLLAA